MKALDFHTLSTSLMKMNNRNKTNLLTSNTLQKVAAYMIIGALFITILLTATDNLRYDMILKETNILFEALYTTLWISVVTLFISTITGFIFYLCMKSKSIFINTLTNTLKEIVMGTPLLVMIFLVVYVLGIKLGIHR